MEKDFDESLASYVSELIHEDLGLAIKDAEQWLEKHPRSPGLLLSLARLNREHKLWGKSKAYFNSSLNLKPNAAVYHEFGQLLETLKENEAAQTCYQYGLRFSLTNKGEVLNI